MIYHRIFERINGYPDMPLSAYPLYRPLIVPVDRNHLKFPFEIGDIYVEGIQDLLFGTTKPGRLFPGFFVGACMLDLTINGYLSG